MIISAGQLPARLRAGWHKAGAMLFMQVEILIPQCLLRPAITKFHRKPAQPCRDSCTPFCRSQFAAAMAMYLIAQKCLVDVDGVAYVAPPPPPGPSPPHLGAAPTPPLPPLPGTRAARLLLQQPSQHPPPSLPPPPFPPPHPPSSALPAPPTPSSHLTAGQQHWACLLETNPNNTGACGVRR